MRGPDRRSPAWAREGSSPTGSRGRVIMIPRRVKHAARLLNEHPHQPIGTTRPDLNRVLFSGNPRGHPSAKMGRAHFLDGTPMFVLPGGRRPRFGPSIPPATLFDAALSDQTWHYSARRSGCWAEDDGWRRAAAGRGARQPTCVIGAVDEGAHLHLLGQARGIPVDRHRRSGGWGRRQRRRAGGPHRRSAGIRQNILKHFGILGAGFAGKKGKPARARRPGGEPST